MRPSLAAPADVAIQASALSLPSALDDGSGARGGGEEPEGGMTITRVGLFATEILYDFA
jgi:hypothetical protein